MVVVRSGKKNKHLASTSTRGRNHRLELQRGGEDEHQQSDQTLQSCPDDAGHGPSGRRRMQGDGGLRHRNGARPRQERLVRVAGLAEADERQGVVVTADVIPKILVLVLASFQQCR